MGQMRLWIVVSISARQRVGLMCVFQTMATITPWIHVVCAPKVDTLASDVRTVPVFTRDRGVTAGSSVGMDPMNRIVISRSVLVSPYLEIVPR